MRAIRYWLSTLSRPEHDGGLISWPRWLRTLGRDRSPDFDIGPGYLQRWWVLPRNPIFNVYLHRIARSDDDRALHDHPWWNCSIILRGSYLEIVPHLGAEPTPYVNIGQLRAFHVRTRRAGSIVFRRATAAHRLMIREKAPPAWTLFITGPVIRAWGFHCSHGWRHWQDFTAPNDKARVGRGCD